MQQYFVYSSSSPRTRHGHSVRYVSLCWNWDRILYHNMLWPRNKNTRASDWWSRRRNAFYSPFTLRKESRWRGDTFANQLQALRTMVVTDRYHQPIYEAKSFYMIVFWKSTVSIYPCTLTHPFSCIIFACFWTDATNKKGGHILRASKTLMAIAVIVRC
jgi:hypothetical protein